MFGNNSGGTPNSSGIGQRKRPLRTAFEQDEVSALYESRLGHHPSRPAENRFESYNNPPYKHTRGADAGNAASYFGGTDDLYQDNMESQLPSGIMMRSEYSRLGSPVAFRGPSYSRQDAEDYGSSGKTNLNDQYLPRYADYSNDPEDTRNDYPSTYGKFFDDSCQRSSGSGPSSSYNTMHGQGSAGSGFGKTALQTGGSGYGQYSRADRYENSNEDDKLFVDYDEKNPSRVQAWVPNRPQLDRLATDEDVRKQTNYSRFPSGSRDDTYHYREDLTMAGRRVAKGLLGDAPRRQNKGMYDAEGSPAQSQSNSISDRLDNLLKGCDVNKLKLALINTQMQGSEWDGHSDGVQGASSPGGSLLHDQPEPGYRHHQNFHRESAATSLSQHSGDMEDVMGEFLTSLIEAGGSGSVAAQKLRGGLAHELVGRLRQQHHPLAAQLNNMVADTFGVRTVPDVPGGCDRAAMESSWSAVTSGNTVEPIGKTARMREPSPTTYSARLDRLMDLFQRRKERKLQKETVSDLGTYLAQLKEYAASGHLTAEGDSTPSADVSIIDVPDDDVLLEARGSVAGEASLEKAYQEFMTSLKPADRNRITSPLKHNSVLDEYMNMLKEKDRRIPVIVGVFGFDRPSTFWYEATVPIMDQGIDEVTRDAMQIRPTSELVTRREWKPVPRIEMVLSGVYTCSHTIGQKNNVCGQQFRGIWKLWAHHSSSLHSVTPEQAMHQAYYCKRPQIAQELLHSMARQAEKVEQRTREKSKQTIVLLAGQTRCPICQQGFTDAAYLQHRSVGECRQVVCSGCREEFAGVRAYKEHYIMDHLEALDFTVWKYVCRLCPADSSDASAKKLKAPPSGLTPEQIEAIHDEYAAEVQPTTLNVLGMHTSLSDTQINALVNMGCPRNLVAHPKFRLWKNHEFMCDEDLFDHVKLVHPVTELDGASVVDQIPTVSCATCQAVFPWDVDNAEICGVVEHEIARHPETRPFKCVEPSCAQKAVAGEVSFLSYEEITEHMKAVHQGGKMYKCYIATCKYSNTHLNSLTVHVWRFHHSRTYRDFPVFSCPNCSAYFGTWRGARFCFYSHRLAQKYQCLNCHSYVFSVASWRQHVELGCTPPVVASYAEPVEPLGYAPSVAAPPGVFVPSSNVHASEVLVPPGTDPLAAHYYSTTAPPPLGLQNSYVGYSVPPPSLAPPLYPISNDPSAVTGYAGFPVGGVAPPGTALLVDLTADASDAKSNSSTTVKLEKTEPYRVKIDLAAKYRIQCEFCDKVFPCATDHAMTLVAHEMAEHKFTHPFPCRLSGICSETFTQLKECLNHIKDVHYDGKRFACHDKTCPIEYELWEDMAAHCRGHFECEDTPLPDGFLTNTLEWFQCEICKKLFKEWSLLRQCHHKHRYLEGYQTIPVKERSDVAAVPLHKTDASAVDHVDLDATSDVVDRRQTPLFDTARRGHSKSSSRSRSGGHRSRSDSNPAGGETRSPSVVSDHGVGDEPQPYRDSDLEAYYLHYSSTILEDSSSSSQNEQYRVVDDYSRSRSRSRSLGNQHTSFHRSNSRSRSKSSERDGRRCSEIEQSYEGSISPFEERCGGRSRSGSVANSDSSSVIVEPMEEKHHELIELDDD